MQVEDQVGPGLEPPGHVRRLLVRHRPRLPEQEVAVRVEALGLHRQLHPGKAGLPVLRVAPPRGPRAVDEDVGVVGDLPVVEAYLEGPHVARSGHGHGQDEVPEHVVPAGRQGPGLGQGQHEVELAERPAFREARERRKVGPVALGRSRLHPPPHLPGGRRHQCRPPSLQP